MPAPGRHCGSCSLCCKVMGIDALDKLPGRWCSHFKPGCGCGIYAERPGECRTFECKWLRAERWAEDWRPDRSKLILVTEAPVARRRAISDRSSRLSWS